MGEGAWDFIVCSQMERAVWDKLGSAVPRGRRERLGSDWERMGIL
jgi:hypothetical protein